MNSIAQPWTTRKEHYREKYTVVCNIQVGSARFLMLSLMIGLPGLLQKIEDHLGEAGGFFLV